MIAIAIVTAMEIAMNVSDMSLDEVETLLGVRETATASTTGIKKALLERFITKYNLGGASESVTWVADDTGLSTKFAGDDKNVMGFILAKDIKIEHGSYNIFETALMMNLLKVLDENIEVSVKRERNVPMAFALTDGTTKVTAVLADPRAIPVVPGLKNLPPWDVIINLDARFMTTYIKAKGALNAVDKFTVMCDGKVPTVVLGYEAEHNTNSVNIAVSAVMDSDLTPTHFDADYLKNILLANKEAVSGTMSVSRHGLAHINFVVEGFMVDYYLVAKK